MKNLNLSGKRRSWSEMSESEVISRLLSRVEAEVPRPVAKHSYIARMATYVVRSRRKYLDTTAGKELAARALSALLGSSQLRDALDSSERLGGRTAVNALIRKLGSKPREKLSPEEREERRRAGVDARSEKLAARADTELAKAREKLVAAQKAVMRAEALVRKWKARRDYYVENGRLDPED